MNNIPPYRHVAATSFSTQSNVSPRIDALCNALKELHSRKSQQPQKIILYNRWGNDASTCEIENAKSHRDKCDLMVCFYDKNTCDKPALENGLGKEKGVCLLSYEEIIAFFQEEVRKNLNEKDRRVAQLIISAIDHLNMMTSLGAGWRGRAIDEALLIDPLIMAVLCKNAGILEANNFLLSHQHMTKIYHERWTTPTTKIIGTDNGAGQKFSSVMANPNVFLITQLSSETKEKFFSQLEKNLPYAIKRDLKIINRADSEYEYGEFPHNQDITYKSRYYPQKTTPFLTHNNGNFEEENWHPKLGITSELKDIQEDRGYMYCKGKEIANNAACGSWSTEIIYDSLDKLLSSMLERARRMGKIELLKMVTLARKFPGHEKITESDLIKLLGKMIDARKLTEKDFTQSLIINSTNLETLKHLTQIPAFTGKKLKHTYTERSLGTKLPHKYATNLYMKKRIFKQGYKKIVDQKALESMIEAQKKYNENISEKGPLFPGSDIMQQNKKGEEESKTDKF